MATTDLSNQNEASPDLDKVIARIQKILSRTKEGSGTTEAEADTALKMAQELALKHNLDMAAIEASAASNNSLAPAERVKDELKGRAMYKWQRQLAKYVAEGNFCYHLIHSRQEYCPPTYELDAEFKGTDDAKGLKSKIDSEERDALTWEQRNMYNRASDGRYKASHKHIFVGRKGNVITAQMMFQYLTQTIEDLVMVEMSLTNAQRLSRSAMSWKEGAADRLCERLAARRRDLIANHDARVKQEEADRQAERDAAVAAKKAAEHRQLKPHRESEVAAAMDAIGDDAYDERGMAEAAEDPDRPDIADDQPWTPEGEAQPEPEVGNALVLASVYDDSEREANYEVAHNLPAGSLAKWRAEAEEARRKAAEERAKEQIDAVEAPVKQETERQRAARIKREGEERVKNRRRWARESEAQSRREQREWEKRDHSAYNKGQRKGSDIGLDTQISKGADPKRIK